MRKIYSKEKIGPQRASKVLYQNSPERIKSLKYIDKICSLIQNRNTEAIINEFKDITPQQREATRKIIDENEAIPDEDKKYFSDLIKNLTFILVHNVEKSREELETELAQVKQRVMVLEKEREDIINGQTLTKEKVKAILSKIEGFKFLNQVVDLGKPTNKLPKEISLSKKWDVQAYPKEWSPEDKARAYLKDNWMNYGVSLSYFKNSNFGNGFFKYLVRNEIDYLLPAACEQEIIRRLEEMR